MQILDMQLMKKGPIQRLSGNLRASHAFMLLFLITLAFEATGQTTNPSDTNLILTEAQYIQLVKTQHPVVRQAFLLRNRAEAEQQKARGAFDPKLFGEVEQKSFDQKNYFTIGEGGLKVASWYGLEFKASYLWSNGVYLNPENKLPAAGQAVVGISANVLQGLLIDERRAALQQAKILQELNETEQRQIINDILLAARKTYWEWFYAYQETLIFENALRFTREQLDAVRESYFQGDKPAIDTLESMIALQNRQVQLNEASLNYQNARLALSNFLWSEENVPLEIQENVLPISQNEISTELPQASALTDLLLQQRTHPILQSYSYKLAQLDIDRKLKIDKLKPTLNLEFNLLSNGSDFIYNPDNDPNSFNALFTENYKWGARFQFPLLLRKERAAIELNQVKTLETEYQFNQKQLELENKLKAAFQEQQIIANQIDIQEQMVRNYQRLLEAEREKFQIGESSVFLINSRQQKLVEAELKAVKLQIELQKILASLDWTVGNRF